MGVWPSLHGREPMDPQGAPPLVRPGPTEPSNSRSWATPSEGRAAGWVQRGGRHSIQGSWGTVLTVGTEAKWPVPRPGVGVTAGSPQQGHNGKVLSSASSWAQREPDCSPPGQVSKRPSGGRRPSTPQGHAGTPGSKLPWPGKLWAGRVWEIPQSDLGPRGGKCGHRDPPHY